MKTTESKTTENAHALPLRAITENGTLAPSNDNAAAGAALDTTPLVARGDVVRYLRATLRRYGVAPEDTADAIADAQLAAIEVARTGRMPSDPAGWKALAATIAARSAIDRLRETEARRKYDAGLCEDPDAFAPPGPRGAERDPVDTKTYLDVLKDLFDSGWMPEHAAEILWGEADQTPHAEIAAELGVTETVVDNRLCRMRTTFRARLVTLGLLSLLLLAGVLLASWEKGPVARPTPTEPTPSVRRVPAWDAGTARSDHSSSPVKAHRAVPE